MNLKFIEALLPRYTYLGYTVDYSPTPCLTKSLHAVSSLSFGVRFGIITCRLHPTCITYRPLSYHTLIYRHPLNSSLCRRKDMDPTSSWVFAFLCQSPGPFPRHRSLPTLLHPCNMIFPASSTMHHLTPTPTKPSIPLPWLSGPAPTPTSCPDPSRAASLAARLGLETPHPTFLTHPQKVTDKAGKTNSPLFVPPAYYNLTLLIPHHPLSLTTPLFMPSASAYPWW